MSSHAERCPCGVQRRNCRAYDESTFRYFLALERKRAERLRRPVLLLRLSTDAREGTGGRLEPALGARILSSVSHAVREVDVIGWLRHDRVVGAILTQGTGLPSPDVCRAIEHRLIEVLSERLPGAAASRMRVQVLPSGH